MERRLAMRMREPPTRGRHDHLAGPGPARADRGPIRQRPPRRSLPHDRSRSTIDPTRDVDHTVAIVDTGAAASGSPSECRRLGGPVATVRPAPDLPTSPASCPTASCGPIGVADSRRGGSSTAVADDGSPGAASCFDRRSPTRSRPRSRPHIGEPMNMLSLSSTSSRSATPRRSWRDRRTRSPPRPDRHRPRSARNHQSSSSKSMVSSGGPHAGFAQHARSRAGPRTHAPVERAESLAHLDRRRRRAPLAPPPTSSPPWSAERLLDEAVSALPGVSHAPERSVKVDVSAAGGTCEQELGRLRRFGNHRELFRCCIAALRIEPTHESSGTRRPRAELTQRTERVLMEELGIRSDRNHGRSSRIRSPNRSIGLTSVCR